MTGSRMMKSALLKLLAISFVLIGCSKQEPVVTNTLKINNKTHPITQEQYAQISTYTRVLCKMSSYMMSSLTTETIAKSGGSTYQVDHMTSSMRFDMKTVDQNFKNKAMQKAMKLEDFVEAGITEPASKLNKLLSAIDPDWSNFYLYHSNEAPLDKVEAFDTYFYQITTLEKSVFGCDRKLVKLVSAETNKI